MSEETIASSELSATELACSLNPEDLRNRRALFRKTLMADVESVNRLGQHLDITFGASTDLTALQEFIRLESQCCGFLEFTVRTASSNQVLVITAPPGAEHVLDMFQAGAHGQQNEGQ